MNYQQTVDYLYRSTPVFEHVGASAYKPGLANMIALDNHFGNPHRQFKTIHVAGTNGKGSCSHTLASILQEEGYKVGLYTSPHLVDFRERIRVNGIPVSREEVVKFVAEEKDFFEPLHPSFFELTTALAFKYFAESRVDIAVIEVGLGGRLDSTNIITPIISIITNISMDHTQFLGDTLERIAGEKAGIIKPHVPVIIGETVPETKPVFLGKAEETEAPVYFAEDNQEVISSKEDIENFTRIYQTKSFGIIKGDLMGNYQEKNTNTILNTLLQLKKMNVIRNDDAIHKGFSHVIDTGLLGRWQRLQKSPTVVLDTGHNIGGWKYISENLKSIKCKQLRIVFGMVNDKDLEHVMKLLPENATFYWTQPSSKRAFPVEKIQRTAQQIGLSGKTFSKVIDAYRTALDDSDNADFIFVGGSSYVIADLLAELSDLV